MARSGNMVFPRNNYFVATVPDMPILDVVNWVGPGAVRRAIESVVANGHQGLFRQVYILRRCGRGAFSTISSVGQ